ncbi:MFS transporter [Sphingomonas bacterium]|uniref:MFS transporter n=1 Tax=Sphingomonas bacterium TaxID=1895847 RepID=UPI001C2DDD60|nr:MFS transporter [Sphingomonas bacterium]
MPHDETPRAGAPNERSRGADDGLPLPRRRWAVASIWLGAILAVLDSSIANIALPTISHELGATPAASVWVVNAYQIAITILLLPLAALGDILGCKRVYAAGLTVFVLSSIGCALAGDLTSLALARFVQGFGAAAMMAMNGALVRFAYPRAMLGRGVGYISLVVASSSAAGPGVAAAILAVASWRWLFAINVPIGLAALAIGWRHLSETGPGGRRFDWRSALLSILAFGSLFLVVSDIAQGQLSARTGLLLVAGLVTGTIAIRVARGQKDPLVPIDLLRVPVLRLSYATSSCSFAAQMIGLVALPFYLESRFGYGHVATGLLITTLPLGVAVAAPLAGRLVDRHSSGLLGGVGLALLAAGYALIAALAGRTTTGWLIVGLAACGFGFGLFQAPNNRTMLGVAPARRSGAAAGMLATARLVGQTLGAVVVALLFRLVGTVSVAPFLLAAALGIVAAGFSIRRLGVPA